MKCKLLKRPLVSVIIPYHNEGDFVNRALQSVSEQTYEGPIEIIVIDDASNVPPPITDDRKCRIRVIRSAKNVYAAAARNLGIQNAEGEFVCFLDADDVFLPEKLDRQVEFLRRRPELSLVGSGGYVHRADVKYYISELIEKKYGGREWRTARVLGPETQTAVCLYYLYHTCGFIVRREALERVGGFDGSLRWGEEWDLQVRLAQIGGIGYVPGASYRYLCRTQSITSTSDPRKQKCAAHIYHKWRRAVKGLSVSQIRELKLRQQNQLLLAAQIYLEEWGDARNGLACACQAIRLGPSVWACRSLVRMGLHTLVSKVLNDYPEIKTYIN